MCFFEKNGTVENEQGFVLVIGLIVLLLLSLMGIWGLNTTTTDITVAGNDQYYKSQFNIAEGGTYVEAGKIGYSATDWYKVVDPSTLNQLLVPGAADYYPAGYTFIGTMITSADKVTDAKVKNTINWPLLYLDQAQSETLYSYLVTYLYADAPPKGYDASQFSGYKFRINGAATVNIEIGGIKVGVKSTM